MSIRRRFFVFDVSLSYLLNRKLNRGTFHLLDPVIDTPPMEGFRTRMSIQPVNDFHPFHAFLREELDDGPLLYFHAK
jgi:hypothetical protein